MHFENKGDFIIAAPNGRIDSSNSNAFGEEVNNIVNSFPDKKYHLIIDLGQIEYISSAGLRVLLVLDKRQKENSMRMIISSMNQNVQKVFESSGFSKILTISSTVGEAMKLWLYNLFLKGENYGTYN